MFKTFFLSELKYNLKQPMVYIFLGLMTLMVFGATASDNVQIGGAVGNVFRNAPHIITTYVAIMSIFGLLIATAFYNNAALRDYDNQFHEILFSTPISKAGYFFGRFFAALIIATIPILGVFLGSYLGSVLAPLFGWIDADRFGSFYLETFVNNYLLFILPNMFFAGAVIYTLATTFKSTVISFTGTLVIIIAYIITGTLMSDIDNETLAALVDTFGIRTYSVVAKYFTPIEKNTLSPSFTGLLLMNRIIWTAFGTLILLFSYYRFSFAEKSKRVKAAKEEKSTKGQLFSLPNLHPAFTRSTNWLQFKSFFRINFLSIIKSTTFKILFVFSAILLFSNLYGGFEYFGLHSYPLTYKMIDTINGATIIFVVIVLVFFSGELIWRDRDFHINEVLDATPHTSFISMAAKALSLVAVTTVLHFFFIISGILYQLFNGYTRIELDVYLLDFFYNNLMLYIIWSSVMIFIQVVINNKYIGYFVSILVIFLLNILLAIFDMETNMLSLAGKPSLMYSDMNGFGPGLVSANWFNLYWVLFGLIALLMAGALWNRGVKTPFLERIKIAKNQVPKSFRILIISVMVIWIAVAGFIYYNTQILNPYKTTDQWEELSANYEKKYKKYEKVKLPKIAEVKYFVDIFPEDRNAFIKAKMKLVNETESSIDSIHYSIDKDWHPEILIPHSELVLNDEEFGYQIYKLDKAMQPGDTINIEIHSKYISQGFQNGRGNTNIVRNGTFFNNMDCMPQMGYRADTELSDKNTRKKYELKPKERMPKLEANCTKNCMANYLSQGHSDWINVETTISTSADQTAIAPGSLLKKWTENGRNYYHYQVDHPSQNFYAFISARYEVATRKWNGIDLEVYYDKKHGVNVTMMLDAVQRSLANYIKNFGPYYHKQCRVIEFPRYATFAQAFPGSMPYSEAFGFVVNLEDESDNNVIDAVISHEMAHQWWAHQVVGAAMQGGTMLSESFAEYSSLITMKSITPNPMKMRDFLKYDHNRYLRGRSGETEKELPLYKVENQGYIHYGKGSVILYALQDYIGEDKVNLAMKNFLDEYKYQAPPYPTSLDFLRYLEPQIPDSLQYLVKDWFKEITLYDNRLKEAKYEKLPDGKYRVSMDIESNKIKADSIGNETKVAINDWIDIGAFSDADEKHLMYRKRVKFDKPKMTFSFDLDSIPAKLAIDPLHLLIDRVYNDNVKKAEEL
jgi:ABC-type transport system involved in multi-copper enzyme maturation permease subunit